MWRNLLRRNFAGLVIMSVCALVLAGTPVASVLAQETMGQYQGRYPGRPEGIARQCQEALSDRVSADAGRRVNLNLDSQIPYSASNGRQGLRGNFRYGFGGPNSWRTATYDCVVDPRSNRVERVRYDPRAGSGNWPGGPGYPGGPDVPVENYPRVKVDTSMRGTYNSRSGSFEVERGYVDSRGSRPAITLRGRDFRITFYGVVEQSVGAGFTMRITGSDRGYARGTAQARFNNDLNEIDLINVNGRIGRDEFSGSFNRR